MYASMKAGVRDDDGSLVVGRVCTSFPKSAFLDGLMGLKMRVTLDGWSSFVL